jgi:carbonic anhydrase
MTNMTPMLEHNEQFAGSYAPVPLAPPATQTVIVACMDHRVDPAIVLGLQLGDAQVIRNSGGRVTPAVVGDIAFLAYLAEHVFGAQDKLFEVAVIHHPVRDRFPRRPQLPAANRRSDGARRGGAGGRRRP